jgi:hypothetical protein
MTDYTNSLAGTHRARATEWALGMSSTGKEQIAIMFELVGGPHDGKHITAFLYFTDNTVDRTLESMRHCGWDSDNLAELDNLGANEVELVIEDESYEGKTRSRVKWINRVSRLALKEQLDPGQVAAFAARMRGKTVASKQKYGAQPAAAAKPTQRNGQQASFDNGYAKGDPGYSDDEAPF